MTQSNQVQIPAIQTSNDALNQVQQNINKVLRNLNGQIQTLTLDMDNLTIIGEVKFASLTLPQFQSQAGNNWILANGQSSVGTQYAILFKTNVVPNVSVSGITAFIRVN